MGCIVKLGGKDLIWMLNQNGSPQHPLYLKASRKPFPLEAA